MQSIFSPVTQLNALTKVINIPLLEACTWQHLWNCTHLILSFPPASLASFQSSSSATYLFLRSSGPQNFVLGRPPFFNSHPAFNFICHQNASNAQFFSSLISSRALRLTAYLTSPFAVPQPLQSSHYLLTNLIIPASFLKGMLASTSQLPKPVTWASISHPIRIINNSWWFPALSIPWFHHD